TAAYAVVPAGTAVSLMMTSGGRATLPSSDGEPWGYVLWRRDLEGVAGWVPLRELDGGPNGHRGLSVRRAAPKDIPTRTPSRAAAPGRAGSSESGEGPQGAAPDDADRPVVAVHARDVLYSTDAIGITVPDPYTIVFETADPTPYFVAITNS